MKNSLLRRNIGLLVGVVLAGQVLAGLLMVVFVLQPQTTRVADISARMLNAVSVAMQGADAGRRDHIARQIDDQGSIRLRHANDPPGTDGRAYPNFLEQLFMRALAERLGSQDELHWRTDRAGRLWMEVQLGGEPWWVSITAPRLAAPLLSLILVSMVAFMVAATGGLLLQRRLDSPLRKLAQGVASFQPGSAPAHIDVDGPREISAVAQAFNDMADRISAHEDERTLMLAGVSHDLRTPLARLRLSIEMMQHDDTELRESANRQVEQIDYMLGQFLDFARTGEEPQQVQVLLRDLLVAAVEDAGLAGQVEITAPAQLRARLRPMAMRRAIKNLLENAVRYGAPPIKLRARSTAGRLEIAIIDRGMGFDPDNAAHFLKPFAMADAARSAGQGTGLGLAIAQKCVSEAEGELVFKRTSRGFCAMIVLPGQGVVEEIRAASSK